MLRALRLLLPALVVALVALASARAEAKPRGLILITYGEDVVPLADLDPEVAASFEEDYGRVKVGYYYEYFGLFFIDLWTSGGEHVLYTGDTIIRVSDEEIATAAGVSSIDDLPAAPFFARVPAGWLVMGIPLALFLFHFGYTVIYGDPEQEDATFRPFGHDLPLSSEAPVYDDTPLPNDERYDRAMALYEHNENMPPEQRTRMSIAVLVKAGIREREARKNFERLTRSR